VVFAEIHAVHPLRLAEYVQMRIGDRLSRLFGFEQYGVGAICVHTGKIALALDVAAKKRHLVRVAFFDDSPVVVYLSEVGVEQHVFAYKERGISKLHYCHSAFVQSRRIVVEIQNADRIVERIESSR